MPEYQCQLCDLVFNMKYKYDRHVLVHTKEKPFKCEYCDKAFSRKDKLNTHMLVHLGKNPFKCEVCQLGFPRVSHLKAHIKEQHQEQTTKEVKLNGGHAIKLHTCPDCGKIFNRRDKLVRHCNSVHTQEKPFVCEICLRAFSRKDKLKNHRKIHFAKEGTDSLDVWEAAFRPADAKVNKEIFSCRLCPLTFDYPSMFEDHVKSHGVELPFKCDKCPREFYLESNLQRHEKVHASEKPLSFEECLKTFSDEYTQKNHMKNQSENSTTPNYNNFDQDIVEDARTDPDSEDEDVMEYSFNPEDINMMSDVEEEVEEIDPTDFLDSSYLNEELESPDHFVDQSSKSETYIEENDLENNFDGVENGENGIQELKQEINSENECSIIITNVQKVEEEDPITVEEEPFNQHYLFNHSDTPDQNWDENEEEGVDPLEMSNSTYIGHMTSPILFDPDSSFPCDVCGKEFSRKDKLTRHKKIHLLPEEKPYKCKLCTKTFARSDKYKDHVKRHYDANGQFKPLSNCDSSKPTQITSPPVQKSSPTDQKLSPTDQKLSPTVQNLSPSGQVSSSPVQKPTPAVQDPSLTVQKLSPPVQKKKPGRPKKDSLEKHLQSPQKERLFGCSQCKKSFKSAGFLKRHEALHNTSKETRDPSSTDVQDGVIEISNEDLEGSDDEDIIEVDPTMEVTGL